MWEALIARFQVMSRAQILAKKRNFFAETYKSTDTIESFVYRLEAASADLAGQINPVSDDDKLAVLLNGLSSIAHLAPTVYSIEQDPKSTYKSALLSIR